MVLEFIERVWNDRDLDKVENFMVRDLLLETIGHRTVIRPEGYRRALLRMIRPFPTGQFAIRDIATNHAERYAGLRVAVTWVFTGSYNGTADFGPLTNAGVEILGVSQFLVQSGRIVREVRIYDEIGLRTQIVGHRGDVPAGNSNIY